MTSVNQSFFSFSQSDWIKGKASPILKTPKFFYKHGLLPEDANWSNRSKHDCQIVSVFKSSDSSVKFLIALNSHQVEAVLLPFRRYVICLSTQVGCAANCSFCFTGKQGFKRNLTSEEIVAQYWLVRNWMWKNISAKMLSPKIVFMGQGEPLHNFEAVKKAINLFVSPWAFHLGPSAITLSTIAPLHILQRLDEIPDINIAVSLHAANDAQRKSIIPLSEKDAIESILEILKQRKLRHRQYIMIEYTLIKDINDGPEDAVNLSLLLKEFPAIVNLIPYNTFPLSQYQKPNWDSVECFKNILVKNNIRTMIRKVKGDDVLAACGQLNILKSKSNRDENEFRN